MKSLHVKVLMLSLIASVTLHATSLNLSGSVISENQKTISSRYMGFVQAVYVSEGDVVKKGDLLYTIDSKEVDTALTQSELATSQAELNLKMYENQYKNSVLNLERYQRLLAKDMVSKYEVENLELSTANLKATVEIAQKQVASAKQKRQEVQNQYQYLKVKAPNESVVIEKHIKAGEMALSGVPTLVLADLSSLKISTEIAESYLKSVKIGDRARVEVPSIGCISEGKVEAIIPSSNPMAHTFKMKLSFTCKEAKAYPGMYAIVVLGE
ncbi:efflux RND transporter periplasmic adaptor subunit [Sulfurospirillum arsenophilum]|uniref:efflux RND transporter periplasmic adaptor subunit n=1 Tax=Sulfurospirillum arsenophilum TaxID=56698 RepID=UPI000A64D5EA|nr:efflux RND transporter periplasmic adaptor subunit [Sulfurospirillum arsenophilum]